MGLFLGNLEAALPANRQIAATIPGPILYYRRHGLRAAPPVSTTIEAAGATGMSVAASILALSPATGPAAPFVAIAAGIASLLALAGVGSGCGQTCIAATDIVNQVEPYLRDNSNAYLALPAPRSLTAQLAAEQVFMNTWAAIASSQGCGNPALGNAGKRCISDRDRGGKFDWFHAYYDPIATDTNVTNDVFTASLAGIVPADILQLWPVGLLVLGLLL